jgi:hypothetical protein
MEITGIEGKQFQTPGEELEYLRGEVARKEKQIKESGAVAEQKTAILETVKEYAQVQSEKVLHQTLALPEAHADAIVLELSPETHDKKIEELLAILQEKGVKNTLSVLEKMNNPHLEDDFHRFLVEYVRKGFPITGLTKNDPLFRALNMVLYEVVLPTAKEDERAPKTLKELLSSMEQFYASMLSVQDQSDKARAYFTLEIANANHSHEFIFYSAVHQSKKDLFEKGLLSIFPNAKIIEKRDDYNIFHESGSVAGSYATLSKKPVFSLKTYDRFDLDPLNVVLNSFSKIDRDGEGAAIQIVFAPAGEGYTKKYAEALRKIEGGEKVKDAVDIPDSFFEHLVHIAKDFQKVGKDKGDDKAKAVDQLALENIKNKISTPIVETNIRLIASAPTTEEATDILSHIEASFNQFEDTNGNKFIFSRVKKSKLDDLVKSFSFRLFSDSACLPLSLKELSTVMHFPTKSVQDAPQLKQAKAGTAPVSAGLAQAGTLLGVNINRNLKSNVYIGKEDRMRHFYTIGQTGTGKTTLLKNMITQDILNGDGVCMIDPHGSDIQDILAIIPKHRYEDVIYFDPSYTARPMALNMLEYDVRYPEQKTFVVNEMLSIFNKLFDMKVAGGPMFEQYFRNAVLLVLEDPETGTTLLEVARVLASKTFRELKISKCKNPIVVQFWKEVAEKAGGESALANMVPYITNKFDVFLSNEIMRPIIGQEKSSFNFREIMDGKKILLVNLAKGRLGDINSHLLGLILVGKILMAALSRVDSFGKDMPPFYLYIDEFQNVTTDSIATILSEARKYKLSLTIAHQFIAQLDEKIKNAVFGNVGSIASFRVGAEDAEYLEKQFAPVFTASDIMNLDNHNAYIKMLSEGRPVKPFNIEAFPPPQGDASQVSKLKELSYLKFGKERSGVESEIMGKYKKPEVVVEKKPSVL